MPAFENVGVSPVPQTFTVGSRSLFVTGIAWLFIVLGALVTGWAVLQRAAVEGLLVSWQASGVAARAWPLALDLVLALSLVLLASAVGLLLRLEGARRTFIVLLGLVLAAHLVGLWLQQEVLQSLAQQALGGLPQPVVERVGGFVTATRALSVALGLVAALALAGTVRRLCSPQVRQEFA